MSELDRIQKYKNQLILLGVTGYTNSGSKSLSNILRKKSNPFLLPKENHIYSKDYISNKKLAIAENYFQRIENGTWKKFEVIKVSHIILIISFLMDDEVIKNAAIFAKKINDDINTEKIISSFDNKKDKYKNIKNILSNKLGKGPASEFERYIFNGEITLLENAKNFSKTEEIIKKHKPKIINFLNKIREIKEELANELNEIPGTYTILFQYLGFIIRKGKYRKLDDKDDKTKKHFQLKIKGTTSDNSSTINTNYHTIPSVIFKVINIYRIINEIEISSNNNRSYDSSRIIIESLRNQHEIHYLRSLFPNFFMIAVHRDDNERKTALEKKMP